LKSRTFKQAFENRHWESSELLTKVFDHWNFSASFQMSKLEVSELLERELLERARERVSDFKQVLKNESFHANF
jgi:hypothetical protein